MNRREVARTGGLGLLAVGVAVGSLVVVAGCNADRGSKPFLADRSASHRAATVPPPHTAGPLTAGPLTGGPLTGGPLTGGPLTGGPLTGGPRAAGPRAAGPRTPGPRGTETAQAAPLAPAGSRDSPSRSPSPMPMGAGRWSGLASITVKGQDFGCTAVTTTVRRPATLRIDHPLPGENNAVHLAFSTNEASVEGSFSVDSSANSATATRYWTLSGDGVGGLIGRLAAVTPTPLSGQAPVENVLSAVKSLDQRCGAQISAPVTFPLGAGTALRATIAGKRASVRLSGRTADHTRTFQITFASP